MGIFLWIAGVAVVLVGGAALVRVWKSVSATRLVVCPETGTHHAVQIDPAHRLAHPLAADAQDRLRDCSRWPERSDCDQPCLSQIAGAPDGCRVKALLDDYYAGQACALCGTEFPERIDWYAHEPAFIDAGRKVLTWRDVPAERLPETMESHYPLCWDCKVIERVRQRHPERVTDRLAH